MKNRLNFKCLDGVLRIHAAQINTEIGDRPTRLAFRIDGRDGTYRVDVSKPLIPVWEAIDGGQGFASLDAAKAHANKWLCAAEKQSTLSPQI